MYFQRELMCSLLGLSHADIFYENLRSKVSERVGDSQLIAVERLGLLHDINVVKCGSPLDSLSQYLTKKLNLGNYCTWILFVIVICYTGYFTIFASKHSRMCPQSVKTYQPQADILCTLEESPASNVHADYLDFGRLLAFFCFFILIDLRIIWLESSSLYSWDTLYSAQTYQTKSLD